jgi:hypothetical protein
MVNLSKEKTRSGSALLITLLVVSLLLVMVLSLVVVVRMELRKVTAHQLMLEARANARLGAELAIARMQELTGPDTRVTAPVPGGAAPRWLGQAVDAAAYVPSGSGLVFNADHFGRTRGYFLSVDPGTPFNPATFDPFDADGRVLDGHAPLVGFGSVLADADRVAAPLQSIRNGGGDETGGLAWWASDEGLKAQINLVDDLRGDTSAEALRARRSTAQRVASERFLINFDPDNPVHNRFLQRSLLPSQLDLTGYGEAETSLRFFHDVTLQSLGLPANTRRGGLRRDLTAVFRETELASDGLPDDSEGSQYRRLREFQRERLARWRAETQAAPPLRPEGLDTRHWNALQAVTLRHDQADPAFDRHIFPPMTDMDIKWDAGGAAWEQLLTWATFRQRRASTGEAAPGFTWTDTYQISPVIANVTMANYYTVSWPDVAMHWVPIVVLWNPYDVPIRMSASNPWWVRFNYQGFLGQFYLRLKVSHPLWNVSGADSSHYNHISGNELWTPPLQFYWTGTDNNSRFRFNLRDRNGGMDVVIPPGQARIFSMHRHEEMTPVNDEQIPAVAELREGLAPDGQFSFFARRNFQDFIVNRDAGTYQASRDGLAPGSNGRADINERESRTEASIGPHGYNAWHTTRRRNSHLPFPFPLNPDRLYQSADLLLVPSSENMHIAINENGLNGWTIHEIGAEIFRSGEDEASFRNLRFGLYHQDAVQTPLQLVLQPNQNLPNAMHLARSYDNTLHNDRDRINPVWSPRSIPALDEAFTPATPGFPAWGLSYGLRLPEHSYVFNSATDQGSAVAAPIRWLVDFNPAAPFQGRDPASRIPQDGGFRFDRFGWKSAPMYVGGFFMDDDRYSNLDWKTPDDFNQFIGHSDHVVPGVELDETPRAILYETPAASVDRPASEDLVSMASFMHARLLPTAHDLMPSPLPNFGANYNLNPFSVPRERIPAGLAESAVNHGFAQPAFMIGNANAHLLVARDRAHQAFYPSVTETIPGSIPFAENAWPNRFNEPRFRAPSYFPGYDSSWIYNEVLWDDFFLTPDANTRLRWQAPWTSEDRDVVSSAERVLIEGAFNVNSTSVAAWAALLESMLGVNPGNGEVSADHAPMVRFLTPQGQAFDEEEDLYASPTAYTGFRRLHSLDIWDAENNRGLAVEIVRQVEERGPFLSLSDFVNRALVPEAEDLVLGHGLAGALQTAITRSGLNERMGAPGSDHAWIDPPARFTGTHFGGSAFHGLHTHNAGGAKNLGAPGTLMQADILARIGSVLQARSDTFTIRSFGYVGDDPAQPLARAWSEVTIQRRPEYVASQENDPGDLPADLTPVNLRLGRRYEIIAFRWLGEDEI